MHRPSFFFHFCIWLLSIFPSTLLTMKSILPPWSALMYKPCVPLFKLRQQSSMSILFLFKWSLTSFPALLILLFSASHHVVPVRGVNGAPCSSLMPTSSTEIVTLIESIVRESVARERNGGAKGGS
ncbi:hypothetical protein KP509_01G128600 [Ceratopteris richardii]|uniref:Secreted protein n=1 Tax=Ceratopteris richardii TaxID=49495 RepID=A0A8T2VLI6_CERRI|nr:hypothetical protein KP509_01G128600 [Ceratopteris richardii]